MLASFMIASLLFGQLTPDAPAGAHLAQPRARPAWVEPSLWAMGVSAAVPLFAGIGLAGTFSAAWLGAGLVVALVAASIVAAVMWGLSIEDKIARENPARPRRLAMWPWLTSAVSLLGSSTAVLPMGLFAIGGGSFGALVALAATGVLAGVGVVALLLTGLVVGLVNLARAPEVGALSGAGLPARCGVEVGSF